MRKMKFGANTVRYVYYKCSTIQLNNANRLVTNEFLVLGAKMLRALVLTQNNDLRLIFAKYNKVKISN